MAEFREDKTRLPPSGASILCPRVGAGRFPRHLAKGCHSQQRWLVTTAETDRKCQVGSDKDFQALAMPLARPQSAAHQEQGGRKRHCSSKASHSASPCLGSPSTQAALRGPSWNNQTYGLPGHGNVAEGDQACTWPRHVS